VKVKLYAITDKACGPEFIGPEFIGPVSTAPDETYAKFQEFLEKEGILEWPFDFWETEEKCRLFSKLERFNAIRFAIFVIPRGGSDDDPLKLLETSRRFATHIWPRILVAPISNLELLELVALRDALFAAHYSHDIICEAEPYEDMQTLMPPSARS
jgi:hypothetical protein